MVNDEANCQDSLFTLLCIIHIMYGERRGKPTSSVNKSFDIKKNYFCLLFFYVFPVNVETLIGSHACRVWKRFKNDSYGCEADQKKFDVHVYIYVYSNKYFYIYAPCTRGSGLLVKPMIKSETNLLSAELLICSLNFHMEEQNLNNMHETL